VTAQLYRHRLRGDTAANWAANNPVMLLNEPGVEEDTGRLKLGDATAAWNDLPYLDELWPGGEGGGGGGAVASVDGQTGAVDLSGIYVPQAGGTMTGPLNLEAGLTAQAAHLHGDISGITLNVESAWDGAGSGGQRLGAVYQVTNGGTGGAATVNGFYAYTDNYGAGVVTDVIGMWIEGIFGSGPITNGYALKIEDWSGGNFTNPPYAIYSPGPMRSSFGGDVEVSNAAKGVVLKSVDGTRYRVTVANDGALVTAAA
jgi:hypothetical protein